MRRLQQKIVISISVPVLLSFLFYKLLRLFELSDLPFYGYLLPLGMLAIYGAVLSFGKLHELMNKGTLVGVFPLIILLQLLFPLQLFVFNRGDPYLVGVFCILCFFPLYLVSVKHTESTEQTIEAVFISILFITLFENISYIYSFSPFNYFKSASFSPSTISSYHPVLDIRGRLPGLSGSVFATSALIAGITLYFANVSKPFFVLLGLVCQFFLATMSTFLVFIVFYIFLIRGVYKIVFSTAAAFALFPVFTYKIGNNDTFQAWLPTLSTSYSSLEIWVGAAIGFGTQSPQIDFGEFRILSLLAAFGPLITLLLIGINVGAYRKLRLIGQFQIKKQYQGYLNLCLLIFACNWHYETFMIFPNIFIVTWLFALIFARTKSMPVGK